MELLVKVSKLTYGRLLAGLLVVGLVGCKQEIPKVQIDAEAKLRPLARMYAEFINRNSRRPPKDEKQFRDFLEKYGQSALAGMSVDDFLTSARDNQPFVISYGKLRVTPQGTRIIAYEKTGVDGKRFVADDLGIVEEVAEERFKTMVPDGP